ncbi:MAG: diguanylate cyclase [Planctomycetota bacterium]
MRPDPVDVCLIDDDAEDRALLFRRLLAAGYTVVEAPNAETGLALVRQHHPRVVIADLLLPGFSGAEFCRQVRHEPQFDGTYLIVLTASGEHWAKHEVLDAGADDCLLKPCDADELHARLRNGLRVSKLQERLRHAALTDGLTGLWNHTYFRELLDREFARTRRYGGVASLLMLDLDHFKAVNDTFGHETGNVVLAAMARHLLRMVRDTDVVARYGGEEFAVICPETGSDDATRLAQRIRQTIPEQVRAPAAGQLVITASIGVAATDDPRVTSVRDLIDQADQALYVGKRRGRNQVIRADACGGPAGGLSGLESGVAIAQGELDRLQKQVVSLSMQAKELCLQSVWALVQALEARDPFTAWHSRNTRFYVAGLAEAAALPAALQTVIANAAMLHDLGKIGVPDQILQSPTPLSEEQAAVLRQVPLMTCKILEPLRVFETETLIIRHLRERFDGAGYPAALAGRAIPIGSRLLAVAETFDALTSERPHRSRRSLEQAVGLIEAEAGKQLDPQFTALLARVASDQKQRWSARIARAQAELRSPTSAPQCD